MEKIKVYSAFDLPPTNPTNSGDNKEITYELIHDESDGVDKLIITGEKDLNAEIQSYAEGCSIQNIIKRYELGDKTVINQGNPVYGDFTNAPHTLAEAYETMKKAQEQYAALVKADSEKKLNDKVADATNVDPTPAAEGEKHE